MNLILFAIPFFFLLIALELLAEKIRGTTYYRVNDSITSLSTGILNQATGVAKKLIPFTIYVYVYQYLAITHLPDTWWVWVFAFVAYDFCYYWVHRFGHEINIFWAAHVVHHSSEEYNLTTALRQTSGSSFEFVLYLPLAVLGVSPLMLVTVGALNLIYQYWVHTRHIGKLGWYEQIFVTPSNHRVHHAQNTAYIDRNYGGVFILWDRWFGTFQEELDDDPVVFGIRGALASWNPVWANFQVFYLLWQDCLRTHNWWHKLTLWFRRTGWRPPDVAERYPLAKNDDLSKFVKYDPPVTGLEKIYALVQHGLSTAVTLSLLLNVDVLSGLQQLILIALILVCTWSTGAMLERRASAWLIEAGKYAAVLCAAFVFGAPSWLLLSAIAFALISLALFFTLDRGSDQALSV